ACATPEKAFSQPGPYCTAHTPIRRPLEARLNPSAMLTATRSVRAQIGRIPSDAAPSMMALLGKQVRYSTPSDLRTFAMAFVPCMALLGVGLRSQNRCLASSLRPGGVRAREVPRRCGAVPGTAPA